MRPELGEINHSSVNLVAFFVLACVFDLQARIIFPDKVNRATPFDNQRIRDIVL